MKKKDSKLKVAVSSAPPFVIDSNRVYSGFEVELWEMVAKEIGVTFEYEKHKFQELIPLVSKKKADLAFASITINEKREEIVDFSHPTFDSGLRILLSKNRKNIDFSSTIKLLFVQGYKQLLKPFLFLTAIVFIFANILWFSEAGNLAISESYLPGIFQAAWVSLCTILGTDGEFLVYKIASWPGRMVITLGQLTSLVVLGLLIGEFTAFITARKVKFNIDSPDDLRGKMVATVKGTTSEVVLKNLGAVVVPVIAIDEAYKKLKNNQVEAVVFDAPILTYYSLHEGAEWSYMVGDLFDRQDYGIILPESSPLRKSINLAILTIQENGYYDILYQKWFGKAE